jgi:hypothetical protein
MGEGGVQTNKEIYFVICTMKNKWEDKQGVEELYKELLH